MCRYCKESTQMIFKEIIVASYYKNEIYQEIEVIIDRGYLRLCDPEDKSCLDNGEKFKINFCPVCGEKLEGEKWLE